MAADNQEKIKIGYEVDASDIYDSYDEIIQTTSKFYKKLIQLDNIYHKKIKNNLKEDLHLRLAMQKGLTKLKKRKGGIGAGNVKDMLNMQASKLNIVAKSVTISSATRLKGKPDETKQPRKPGPEPDDDDKKVKDRYGVRGLMGTVLDQMGGGRVSRTAKSPVLSATSNMINKTLGPVIGRLGSQISSLGGIFKTFGGMLSGMSSIMGGAVASFIALVIEADAAQKEMNKRLLSGTGISGLGGVGGLKSLGKELTYYKAANNALAGGLRLTNKEIDNSISTLMKSGVSIKNLGNSYEKLISVSEKSSAVAINWGLSIEEGAKIWGDFYSRTGFGVNKINKAFTLLTQDMKDSGMTANNFLSTIQSISAQFNIFLDQTVEFSKLLSKLSTSGLSQKQAQKFSETMASFGAKDMESGIKRYSVNEAANRELILSQYESVKKQIGEIESGKKSATPEELTQLAYRYRSLEGDVKRIREGKGLVGASLKDIPALSQLAAFLKGEGIKTSKDLRSSSQSFEDLSVKAAKILDMTPDSVRDMMDAVAALGVDVNKNLDDLVSSPEAKETINLLQSAKDLQAESVTRLSGASELTNTILIGISQILDEVVSLLSSWLSPGKESTKFLDRIKDISTKGLEDVAKTFKGGKQKSINDQLGSMSGDRLTLAKYYLDRELSDKVKLEDTKSEKIPDMEKSLGDPASALKGIKGVTKEQGDLLISQVEQVNKYLNEKAKPENREKIIKDLTKDLAVPMTLVTESSAHDYYDSSNVDEENPLMNPVHRAGMAFSDFIANNVVSPFTDWQDDNAMKWAMFNQAGITANKYNISPDKLKSVQEDIKTAPKVLVNIRIGNEQLTDFIQKIQYDREDKTHN